MAVNEKGLRNHMGMQPTQKHSHSSLCAPLLGYPPTLRARGEKGSLTAASKGSIALHFLKCNLQLMKEYTAVHAYKKRLAFLQQRDNLCKQECIRNGLWTHVPVSYKGTFLIGMIVQQVALWRPKSMTQETLKNFLERFESIHVYL